MVVDVIHEPLPSPHIIHLISCSSPMQCMQVSDPPNHPWGGVPGQARRGILPAREARAFGLWCQPVLPESKACWGMYLYIRR